MCSLAQVNEPAGHRLAGVVEVDVALVKQQVDSAIVRQMDDPLQVFSRDHRAGGVGRRVKNDGLGLGGDRFFDCVRSDAEVLCLLRLKKNDLAARVLNDVFEADPVRYRKDDLVAMIDEDLNGIEEGMLFAGGEDSFVNRVVRAEVAGVPLHDCLAQFRNARHHRVAGEVGLDCGDGCVLDVTRSVEVGLAGAKIHQVCALGAEFCGLGGHGHGCGNFNAADAVGKDLGGTGNCHSSSIFTDFRGWRKPRGSIGEEIGGKVAALAACGKSMGLGLGFARRA